MCWEQSRRKRTIATSRSDDNRDEARNRGNEKAGPRTANEPEEFATSPGAPVTEQPGGKPFPLDKLFQERTDNASFRLEGRPADTALLRRRAPRTAIRGGRTVGSGQ